MGMSAVQFKLLPSGVDVDLEKVTSEAKVVIEDNFGIFNSVEEQPIAFGLKALLVSFAFPEEKEIDEIGNVFEKISGVSSVEMVDYRRALG